MGKLTDIQIRAWVKNGEHFEGRSDGDGLYLSFPESYSSPMRRFRYRFAGKQRIMNMGSRRIGRVILGTLAGEAVGP